jgi:hypothetical protein
MKRRDSARANAGREGRRESEGDFAVRKPGIPARYSRRVTRGLRGITPSASELIFFCPVSAVTTRLRALGRLARQVYCDIFPAGWANLTGQEI